MKRPLKMVGRVARWRWRVSVSIHAHRAKFGRRRDIAGWDPFVTLFPDTTLRLPRNPISSDQLRFPAMSRLAWMCSWQKRQITRDFITIYSLNMSPIRHSKTIMDLLRLDR